MSKEREGGKSGHEIHLIRVRDTLGEDPPGRAFLVDRLWPRGVRKSSVHYDEWLRDAAPSSELRSWLHADPDRWDKFVRKYRAELDDADPEVLRPIRDAMAKGPVTLLYGARDTEHNHAVVLRDYLLETQGA
ncbi:DUF488 domain-containing protein [Streptomonospora litoralis]|uniref:MarR family transcriptional regulator n=1 Tax=Streptomonospora litoralis TaxID=2498135 RepID=A0A4V0ZJX9_9ACTN|nr:DUF488 family protein [Streptomonospora litoralis]QBI55042.1 hypothetical protein EKD16_16350 [Streptomonospora litoralis]